MAAVIVPLVMFGLVARQDYQDSMRAVERDVMRSTETFYGQAVNVFQAHELAAERVDEHIRGMSWDEIGRSNSLQTYLRQITEDIPPIQAIWLADAQGTVRNASQPLPAAPISVGDRDYFRTLRENDVGTAVGELVQARVMKGWNFNTARRRGGAGAAFDGVIVITIFEKYFTDYWSRSVSPGATVVALVRSDGKFLGRIPAQDPQPLSLPPNAPLFHYTSNAEQGAYRAVSMTDGIERQYGFRKLSRYGVILIYGQSIQDALAEWRETLTQYGLIFGVAAVALLLLSFLTRQSARRAEMQAQQAVLEDRVRQRTAELHESEARFRAIADNSPDHLLMQDRNLRYVYVMNPQIGLSEQDMLGKTDRDFLSPEDAEKLGILKRQVLETGEPVRVETSLVAPSGELTWFDGSYVPRFNETGQIDGLIGYFRNVTERKRIEAENKAQADELRRSAVQLDAANKELEAFAYSVSHDLRVPLRAVDGFSAMLEKKYRDTLGDEGRRLIGVIREGAQKMGRLIDDILAFSRVGRREIARQKVDMATLVRTACEELAPNCAGRAIRFDIGELPAVRGDPAMLQQVWVNLISNAIKFTRPRTSAQIDVGATPGEAETTYYVRDNGVGFDMRYVNKLFGVFQRLHGVAEFEGTGIGLAIVQRIVVRHGGRVWADGKVGEGATFYFALPVAGLPAVEEGQSPQARPEAES